MPVILIPVAVVGYKLWQNHKNKRAQGEEEGEGNVSGATTSNKNEDEAEHRPELRTMSTNASDESIETCVTTTTTTTAEDSQTMEENMYNNEPLMIQSHTLENEPLQGSSSIEIETFLVEEPVSSQENEEEVEQDNPNDNNVVLPPPRAVRREDNQRNRQPPVSLWNSAQSFLVNRRSAREREQALLLAMARPKISYK